LDAAPEVEAQRVRRYLLLFLLMLDGQVSLTISIRLTVTVPIGVAVVMPPLELLRLLPAAMLVSCEAELDPGVPLVVAEPLTPPLVVPALAVVLVSCDALPLGLAEPLDEAWSELSPEFALPVPPAWLVVLAVGWLELALLPLDGYELLAVVELSVPVLLTAALVVSAVPCTFT
jgi:hypothetical protein